MRPELFVEEKMKEKEFSLVPINLAIGTVYKISYSGDLAIDGFEFGFLYLPAGSGIKIHYHTDDIERYQLVSGVLSVKGEKITENICLFGDYHNVDLVEVDTIIATTKVSKTYLEGITAPITGEFFDYFCSLDSLNKNNNLELSKKI